MKKYLLVLVCLLSVFASFSQFTNTHSQSNPNTLEVWGDKSSDYKLSGMKGYQISAWFPDTSTANNYLLIRNVPDIYIAVGNEEVYKRSHDAKRWILIGGTNCAGTQLISGSITWSGSGLVYDATDLDYYILCSRYFANSTTLTLSVADPTYPRIDKFYADNTGNIGVITGTPSANPQEPAINPLSQLDMGFVYIPAGSTVPAGTTQTVIYNENVEWSGTSDVPSINFAYATNPYIGSLSTYIPSAPNSSYVEWQSGGIDYLFSEAQYLKFWVRLNADFVSDPLSFLDVTFEYTDVTVSQTLSVGNGDYNMDYSLINQWQLVSIPLTGITTYGTEFNSVHFVINSAPASFQLDYIYLLETATVPPVISSGWSLNLNTGTNPTTNGIGTSDSVGVAHKTNGQTRAIMPANGLQLVDDTTYRVMVWNETTKEWAVTYQPTILADSPVIIYQDVYQDRIKVDTSRRGAALATQYYADSVANAGGGGWSLLGNAGTVAGTNFVGTTDNVDLVFKRNGIEAGRIGSIGGDYNTYFGVSSGVSNISGTANTGIGYITLFNNTTGNNNTAVGDGALAYSTGDENTAVGSAALLASTTGNLNTAIGTISGGNLITGIGNVIIGSNADVATSSTDSSVAIGFQAVAGTRQLAFSPHLTTMFLDLDSASGTAPAIAGIDENGNWRKYATPSGGGGSPAGNYGNLQINRNSIFSTPASDSLTFSSATLAVKGALTTTGTITASGNVSGFTGLFGGGVRAGNNTNIYWNSGPLILGNTNDLTIKNAAQTAGANVSIGTSAAVASAILDVNSTAKGALLPRMTGAQAEAISSPATGLIIYCNNANGSVITSVGLWNYNGTAWVTAGAKAYKVLTGNLTQTSTGAPTFTILENTTGVTYTMAYTGVGLYTLTANSGTPFTANKTQVFIGGNVASVGGDNYFMNTSINSTTVIGISSGSLGVGLNDDILNNTPIEIRIYP